MELNELKIAVQHEVDRIADLLIQTSDWMAEHPEIGLNEYEASARISEILSEFGMAVERGSAGLPVAFAAEVSGCRVGPRVAIIAEYDALPEIGHGCGHNIIAAAALGAGAALARVGHHLPGSVVVLGTPAEESTVRT